MTKTSDLAPPDEPDFEMFMADQRARAYWDLRSLDLDDDEIEEELERQMADLRERYEG